ncbi:GH10380 [Drosophila grimshawi]|uniref:GH10380 n=1 Tax=Drosophila grimshawi TaxID=7222 RepID=B4JED9_DROGR|nr:GH10380 [Drosophila grimshawi]
MSQFRELEKSVRWYRGMSAQQIRACNKLLHALRDDIEQESTYRVRECLSLLGLQPIANAKQIKTIIDISYINDLAFLWFLWEAYYKKPHSCLGEYNDFTINEQLILSAIAHLDMTSTMRGLDKILPISDHSKKYQELRRARVQKLTEQRQPKLKTRTKENVNSSPYSVRQVRPKYFAPISSLSKPRDRKVVFPHYDRYKDPMYIIPNESSRWFARYEMSPAKREVKKCISDALAQLFADDSVQFPNPLCTMHRHVKYSTTRKQQQLKLETIQRCMQMLDVKASQRKQRSERIVQQLQREVESAARKLELYKQRQLTALRKITGRESHCQSCQMCTQLVATPGVEPRSKGNFTFLISSDFEMPGDPVSNQAGKLDDEQDIHVLQWGREKHYKKIHLEANKEDSLHPQINFTGSKAYCPSNAKMPRFCKSQCKDEDARILMLNDDGKNVRKLKPTEVCKSPKENSSSETEEFKYCSRRTMKNGLLQWDFFKIFDAYLHKRSTDAEPLIRSYCIQALNKAMEGHQALHKYLHSPQTSSVAADKCAKQIFRESYGILEECLKQREVAQTDRLQITNIDPEDKPRLMDLLKTAMNKLKDNPHYVLVTLPNAHKLPILLDWIADRYGKTYSYLQMNKLVNSSRIVYEQLMKQAAQKALPLPEPVGSHKNLSCRLKEINAEYHGRLNKIALENSRLIWLALRGYSHLTDSKQETFFAYMPTKEQDFLRHNLWKSSDYRKIDSMRKVLKKSLN